MRPAGCAAQRTAHLLPHSSLHVCLGWLKVGCRTYRLGEKSEAWGQEGKMERRLQRSFTTHCAQPSGCATETTRIRGIASKEFVLLNADRSPICEKGAASHAAAHNHCADLRQASTASWKRAYFLSCIVVAASFTFKRDQADVGIFGPTFPKLVFVLRLS